MKETFRKLFSKHWTFPYSERFARAVNSFSFTEKIVFYVFVATAVASVFSLLWQVNEAISIEIPKRGSTVTEGVIGSPRFINPLLALSDADRDVTALIYSGLLKATPEGLVPDLAESYFISEDGLAYSFTLKKNIFFHDGEPVTADDVIFTINRAQDTNLKSPRRANWEGVIAEKTAEREVTLTLRQAYAPFLENMTLGIMPKHIWNDVDSEQFALSLFNIEPIGSGPYQVKKIKRNSGGIPLFYQLSSFEEYALGQPYIENFIVRFFSNEKSLFDAYSEGSIESISALSPEKIAGLRNENAKIERTPLPRVFGIFFNQNQAQIFSDHEVRLALDTALDKDLIVTEVLGGFGTKIDSPIPHGSLPQVSAPASSATLATTTSRTEEARKILEKKGWKYNEEKKVMEKKNKTETISLTFSISTSNAPELRNAAEIIKEEWEKLGAKIEVKLFEPGDLNQNVIRPRKYDALLFGEIIGRDLDLFAFWHSSQRNDPGLNIAMYTNVKTDKLLEEARALTNRDERIEKYRSFEKEIQKDIPAVFTYSPDFIYLIPKKIKGFAVGQVTIPSERFANVNEWYVETEKVWSVFIKDNPRLSSINIQ